MVKRFKKGGYYTLCLVTTDYKNEPYTFCLNVRYISRFKDMLEFVTDETVWYIDVKTKLATPVYDGDVVDFSDYFITNIVKGWQF